MDETNRHERVRYTRSDASLVVSLRERMRDQHRDERVDDLFGIRALVTVEHVDQRIAKRVVHG